MSLGQIISFGDAVRYGFGLTEVKRIEDSVRAGGNAYFTSLTQMFQARGALALFDKVLETVDREIIPFPLRCITYLTPPLLAFLAKNGIEHATLRSVVILLQDHMGNLYQLIAAVSSVALIYFGNVLFGTVSLVILGIGFFDRSGLLPERVRQIIHQVSSPLIFVSALASVNVIDLIFSTINILSYCIDIYFSWKIQEISIPNTPQKVNAETLKKLLSNENQQPYINHNYVFQNTFAKAIPEIDIQILVKEFEKIDWKDSRNMNALRSKLKNDQRFAQRHGNPDQLNDKTLVFHAKSELTSCIDSIKNKRILKGEPIDYDKLLNYMKVIAYNLPKEPSIMHQIDTYMSLAIEGGEYCGPGIFDTAETIYAAGVGESDLFTFRSKVLNFLQDDRNQIMHKLYSQTYNLQKEDPDSDPMIERIGAVIDWHDRHNYHVFVNLLGSEFGLRKLGAENDALAIIDPIMKLIFFYFFREAIHELFWDDHNFNHMIKIVKDGIGTSSLSKIEAYQWWKEWIDRQTDLSAEEKVILQNELSDGKLYEKNIEENGKFTDAFIHAMLMEMGPLEIMS